MIEWDAPDAEATAAVSKPRRPGPKMATLDPGRNSTRRRACTANDPWFTSAPSRGLTASGSLWSIWAGLTAYWARAPGAVCP